MVGWLDVMIVRVLPFFYFDQKMQLHNEKIMQFPMTFLFVAIPTLVIVFGVAVAASLLLLKSL